MLFSGHTCFLSYVCVCSKFIMKSTVHIITLISQKTLTTIFQTTTHSLRCLPIQLTVGLIIHSLEYTYIIPFQTTNQVQTNNKLVTFLMVFPPYKIKVLVFRTLFKVCKTQYSNWNLSITDFMTYIPTAQTSIPYCFSKKNNECVHFNKVC